MSKLELDKVKCSVCDVKNHCKECERDIENATLDNIRILLRIAIDDAYEQGLLNKERDILKVIDDVIEGAKDNG